MKAKIIVDNISDGKVSGEWGLCVYIEYNGKKILLDAGASALFVHNAEIYGINLDDIDIAVLSHAHSDHANGMQYFFEKNSRAKFYLQKDAGENCYVRKFIFHKYIGIPKGTIKKYGDRIVFVNGEHTLCDGVYLIPHKTQGLDSIGIRENMYIKKNGKWLPDDFSHEQSLVFDTEKGLVIFNSCSHGGADAIINEVGSAFPDKRVYALIGGFHLFNKSEKEIMEFADKIRKTNIAHLYTGHCTGQRAYDILQNELGDIIHSLHVGLTMEF